MTITIPPNTEFIDLLEPVADRYDRAVANSVALAQVGAPSEAQHAAMHLLMEVVRNYTLLLNQYLPEIPEEPEEPELQSPTPEALQASLKLVH